jgi:2-(1,2-epoxy-1,2-dihydrophenyl)acetyl-CoA isomerase
MRWRVVSDPTILYESAAGVVTLTLNRPDKLNVFNEAMHGELARAFDRLEADPAIRAVLLTGAGRGFCAGQDLADRVTGEDDAPPDLGATLERLYNPLIRRICRLERPVVCAVNGVAAGAGANLAFNCDIVLAARSAKFMQPFCKLGLVPDAGGTYILPRLVGSARARGLALLGETLSAEQAEAWGLIWRVVDGERLMAEATALARHLATQPTKGLGLIKRALLAAATNDLDAQLDVERDLQRAAGRTEDYREGVAAFMAKRQPTFRGRSWRRLRPKFPSP